MTRQRYGRIQWVRLFVDRMKGRVSPLTPEATGIYFRLFFAFMDRQGPLPDDDRLLASIAQVPANKWRRIRDEFVAHGIYEIRDGHIHDHVAEDRIEDFIQRSRKNTENIGKRWHRPPRAEDAS
jgi:uncharacterized protein YdaU (DUF1376 family)